MLANETKTPHTWSATQIKHLLWKIEIIIPLHG